MSESTLVELTAEEQMTMTGQIKALRMMKRVSRR